MKIIAICGSPRSKGNTATLLNLIIRDLHENEIDAECLMLSDLNIKDCNGCLACEETDCTGYCSINDDMQDVIVPKLLAADALIIGSPTYFDLPTSQLKRFMDRTNMILTNLIGKSIPFGLVVVGQSELSSLEAACNSIRNYCTICKMKESAASPVCVVARDIGDISQNLDIISAAKYLGRQLAGL